MVRGGDNLIQNTPEAAVATKGYYPVEGTEDRISKCVKGLNMLVCQR